MNFLQLQPFDSSSNPANLFSISAGTRLSGSRLHLLYQVQGPIEQLVLPPKLSIQEPEKPERSERKDKLWEHTCFEAFFCAQGQSSYYELNLNPQGQWNLYSFESYRQGMKPALVITPPRLISCTQTVALLALHFELALSEELFTAKIIQMGFTAVLEHHHPKTKTYWALCHPGPQPDFHRIESFTHLLKGETHANRS